MSVSQPEESESSKKSNSKKRKSKDPIDEKFVEIMGKYYSDTNQRLGEIAKRIGYEFDASKKRTDVYEALRRLPGLNMSQKIYVAKLLVNNSKDLDLFFSLPDEERVEMQTHSSSTTTPALLSNLSKNFNSFPKSFNLFNPNCTRTRNRRANIFSRHFYIPKALSSSGATVVETSESSNVTFSETFHLKRPEKLEGKITIRLDSGKNEECWKLTVGCSLPGKWVLHWGVNYIGDVGSEWDQPPLDMRPSGSIPIKDYAIETPFERSPTSSEGEAFHEVKIDFNTSSSIAAINFVLKLSSSSLTAGALGQISNMLHKPEAADSKGDDIRESNLQKRPLQAFYEEHSVFKEIITDNSISVSASHCLERAKNILHIETDLPGDVVIHWGVCIDEGKNWEIPAEPYPPETIRFKNKALRTLLQEHLKEFGSPVSVNITSESNEAVSAHTDGIINEIRNLVSDISSEKSRKTKSREAQESILQEIEKLAAEAYRRGNKSSGDNFHAAPNIDHSQDFVRKDIKEWLRWLRLVD
ncbi:hypothetical protein DH2020_026980 [Rehmannia glutinosa]|uniref:Alpha-glucan water dikinase-like N-terminal Ig-like domain-containing protein n=1 Tax=Rehmannia glutinosa TaxID=99300 RepID=A0ABR0VYB9_REHGL